MVRRGGRARRRGTSAVPGEAKLASHADVVRAMKALGDPARARHALRFFRTGKGEYGEGDRFLGVPVPKTRAVLRRTADLPLADVERLLESEWHEVRLLAVLMLVRSFQRRGATDSARKRIYDLYLRRTDRINNWDLVDSSAEHIVGAWLSTRPRAPLRKLLRSRWLWDRRIAILATFHFIKRGDAADLLAMAPRTFESEHDLMHKAVGWMLREAGSRVDRALLTGFLDTHAQRMPRTMLRYAMEKLPAAMRRRYLARPRA